MSVHIPNGPFPAGLDIMFIEGLKATTIIGINEYELNDPQPVVINVAMGTPHSRACKTDNIQDTIDYGSVRRAVKNLLATHRCKLLESFAESIAQIIIKDFGASWVRVGVAKTGIHKDVAGIGVVIERTAKESTD